MQVELALINEFEEESSNSKFQQLPTPAITIAPLPETTTVQQSSSSETELSCGAALAPRDANRLAILSSESLKDEGDTVKPLDLTPSAPPPIISDEKPLPAPVPAPFFIPRQILNLEDDREITNLKGIFVADILILRETIKYKRYGTNA